MEIRTIRKWFEEFEWKFKPFEKGFEAFEWKFEPFEKDSKHSTANLNILKRIWSIHLEIRTIRKGLESF